MTDAEPHPDRQRTSFARAASRGFGIGQIEARKCISELGPEDLVDLQTRLMNDVGLAQHLAERRPVPFAEYVRELVAKGQVDSDERVETVYRAGFDIGFAAYLVESLSTASAYVPEADHAPQVGVDGEAASRVT